MTTTLKSTKNGAQRNILGKHGIRFIGLFTSFMGLVLLILKRSITGQAIQISAIVLMLIGILLFIGNLKLIFASKSNKEVVLYLLIGLLFIFLAILLVLYGSQVSKWIDLFIGVCIALYGLVLFFSHLSYRRAKYFTLDIILSLLLVASGVLIALLKVFSGEIYVLIVGIIATISGLSHIVMY